MNTGKREKRHPQLLPLPYSDIEDINPGDGGRRSLRKVGTYLTYFIIS